MEAALAKDCKIPPDAPRFGAGAGFFAPDGTGVDSFDVGFCSALASFLTFAAGSESVVGTFFEVGGFAFDGLEAGATGFGAVPRRSLRLIYGLRIEPRGLGG